MDEQFSLNGRGVVLTGAAGHLGHGMTRSLLNAGATVVAVGRDRTRLEELVELQSGLSTDRLIICDGDAADSTTVERTSELLTDRGVQLSGWVNNAFAGSSTLLGELSREKVQETVDAALTDVMMICDEVGTRMAAAGRGSIVNVASMYGIVSPQPAAYALAEAMHSPPAYGAAKAGLIQFTRYAAVHWAKSGVRVNALTPGAFPSAQVQANTSFLSELEARVPMGRVGRVEEIGGSVVFLLSDASSYMTGQQLIVDGGWTAW